MRLAGKSVAGHLILLCVALGLLLCLWVTPVLFAGFPYQFPGLLPARNFAATELFSLFDGLGRLLSTQLLPIEGVSSTADGRLSTVLFALISSWVPWNNFIGWTVVSAVVTAFSLMFFWLAAAKIFGVRAAWVATLLLGLSPLMWQQALTVDNYTFAFFFLFASLASFVWLEERSLWGALVVSGLLLGCSVASKDVFLIFLPWYLCVYLWVERRAWKRGVIGIVLFGAFAGAVYLAPYIGDIRTLGYPANQNLARVWPGAEELENATYLHLYPDPYTYFFDRERFDQEHLSQVAQWSWLARMQEQKTLINYGLRSGFLLSLANGGWLFLNSIPSFFQQARVGSVALWLFLIPGFFFLWKRERRCTLLLLGLVVSSYAIITFVLHYEREHLMDVLWVFMLFAGVGVGVVSDALAPSLGRVRSGLLLTGVLLVLGIEMLQANRLELARLYGASTVPVALAQAEVLKALPDDAVVALCEHPTRMMDLKLLSDRTLVLFSEETVERLRADGMLRNALDAFGVTHLFGYSEDLSARLSRTVLGAKVLAAPQSEATPLVITPFINYILHTIR